VAFAQDVAEALLPDVVIGAIGLMVPETPAAQLAFNVLGLGVAAVGVTAIPTATAGGLLIGVTLAAFGLGMSFASTVQASVQLYNHLVPPEMKSMKRLDVRVEGTFVGAFGTVDGALGALGVSKDQLRRNGYGGVASIAIDPKSGTVTILDRTGTVLFRGQLGQDVQDGNKGSSKHIDHGSYSHGHRSLSSVVDAHRGVDVAPYSLGSWLMSYGGI
jgi:hypothetical protein